MSQIKQQVLELLKVGSESATITFPTSFIGFQGHFPGNPIVPAIVQVLAVHMHVNEILGQDTMLREVTHAKFIDKVHADEELTLVCAPKKESVFAAKISRGEQLVASMNVHVEPKE